ncbi:MAG TPA: hypothetical protein VN812_02520 [Candidatus Acidoferrales bacterium]|nr:hypothetical protein [Candidatus Acidoferrales bacterium]
MKKTDERVAPTVLAKEVEGLGSTIEHLMNAIGAQATDLAMRASWPADKTLRQKIQWLWSDVSIVVQSLETQGANALGYLTNTGPGFATQRSEIANVLGGDAHQPLVQHLLLTLLVRNQGAHLSLSGFGS